jgi:hypothetical protein
MGIPSEHVAFGEFFTMFTFQPTMPALLPPIGKAGYSKLALSIGMLSAKRLADPASPKKTARHDNGQRCIFYTSKQRPWTFKSGISIAFFYW